MSIGAEDLVISSNPFVTHFYLGRVDGYLREKVTTNPRYADTPVRQMIDHAELLAAQDDPADILQGPAVACQPIVGETDLLTGSNLLLIVHDEAQV